MTGWAWAAAAVLTAGVLLVLFGLGWGLGRSGRQWPGPKSQQGPVVVLAVGVVTMIGGWVWALMLA